MEWRPHVEDHFTGMFRNLVFLPVVAIAVAAVVIAVAVAVAVADVVVDVC